MEPIRTSIVEDDTDTREWFAQIVEQAPSLLLSGSYASSEEFQRQMFSHPADIVLMDMRLPGMSGHECIMRCKPLLPSVQFLVCTVMEEPQTVFAVLKAGAAGYILKSTPAEEVVAAIELLYRGGSPMTPAIARMVVDSFTGRKAATPPSGLTERELQIVNYLDMGLRYKEIADKLCISTETVRTHIRNVYTKLHVRSRTEALNILFDRGQS